MATNDNAPKIGREAPASWSRDFTDAPRDRMILFWPPASVCPMVIKYTTDLAEWWPCENMIADITGPIPADEFVGAAWHDLPR